MTLLCEDCGSPTERVTVLRQTCDHEGDYQEAECEGLYCTNKDCYYHTHEIEGDADEPEWCPDEADDGRYSEILLA